MGAPGPPRPEGVAGVALWQLARVALATPTPPASAASRLYDPRSAIQNRMCPNAAHWPFGSIGSTLAHFLCEKSRLAAASTKIESGVLLQRVCRTWTQNGLFIAHTSKNRCAQTNRDQKIAQDT